MSIFSTVIAALILILGVPSRLKYYWQGSKIRRRESALDVSRKFYIVSWFIYALQVVHCSLNKDWVNVAFWGVGIITVGYCIRMCYRYWHVKMSFLSWVKDSFTDVEEGGILK